MGFKMKGFSGFKGSPAKQKYDYTITDSRSDEDIQKEKDEIKKAEDWKKKDQERINQQIEGTYVETEEDKERMMKDTKDYRRSKKDKSSPAKISSSELREAVGKVSSAQHQYRQPGWAQVGSAIFGGGTDKQKTSSKKTTSEDDDDTTTEETVRPPSIDEIVSDKLFSGLGKKLGLQKWKE